MSNKESTVKPSNIRKGNKYSPYNLLNMYCIDAESCYFPGSALFMPVRVPDEQTKKDAKEEFETFSALVKCYEVVSGFEENYILVSGHAADYGNREQGDGKKNWELSWARARAMACLLTGLLPGPPGKKAGGAKKPAAKAAPAKAAPAKAAPKGKKGKK